MARPRPRSLRILLLLGCACLALPLAIGLVRASGYVERIGDEAAGLLHQGVETARRTRAVVGVVEDLARNARQLEVLPDASLILSYDRRHRRLLAELAAVEDTTRDRDARIAAQSRQMRDRARDLHRMIVGPDGPDAEPRSARPGLEDLARRARTLERMATQRFDAGLRDLNGMTDDARRALFVQALALVPVTVVLALVFSALVMHPVRVLARSLRRLGEGQLEGSVTIPGPREIASLGQDLEWLRARLDVAEAEKNGFLRRVSHELKTPLASLREGAELLGDGSVGALDPAQREVVEIMLHSASRLEMQIHNLLASTATGAGIPPTRASRLRVDQALERCLRDHRLVLAARRIRVHRLLAPVSVEFDPQQLRMTLDNLLGNAIKFTPPGGWIRLSLEIRRGLGIVEFTDSGPGIPSGERELVFRAFYQGHSSTTTARGTGIGLSVVRDCVSRHGGRIRILPPGSGGGAHLRVVLRGARREG